MNYESIKSVIDKQFSDWIVAKPHRMVSGREVCRVTMPLLEPNGDTIQVYLTETDGKFVVEDGGHVAGLLYEVSGGNPSEQDWDVVERQLFYTGLKKNDVNAQVYIETDENGLRYWMIELAQLIAILPHLLPQRKLSRETLDTAPDAQTRHKGNRTAEEVANKLRDAGFGHAIRRDERIQGVTQNMRQVDLVYTVPAAGFGIGKSVYILVVDLDGRQALDKAGRKLAIANDLAWSIPSYSERKVDVRIVYGIHGIDREDDPAVRLLAAAGEHSPVKSFGWNDPDQQDKFMVFVKEDLSTLSEISSPNPPLSTAGLAGGRPAPRPAVLPAWCAGRS